MLFYISPYPTELNTCVLGPSFHHKSSVWGKVEMQLPHKLYKLLGNYEQNLRSWISQDLGSSHWN